MGSLDDGYVTSTGYMMRAYKSRPEDFKRKILYEHYSANVKELRNKEQYFLNMINDDELEGMPNCRYYNMKKNAEGLSGVVASRIRQAYWDDDERSAEQRKRVSTMSMTYKPNKGKSTWNKGKVCPSISEGRKNGKKPYVPTEVRSSNTKRAWEEGAYDNRPKPTKEQIERGLETRRLNGNDKHSEETKEKISKALKGKVRSEEHSRKIGEAAKERQKTPLTCPHCGHEGRSPNIYRFHFKNCKHC